MVDVPPVILKFWAILESCFSKVRQFFSNFFDFVVIWRFLIELKHILAHRIFYNVQEHGSLKAYSMYM